MQVQRKENELDQLKDVISSKEHEVAQLKLQGTVIEYWYYLLWLFVTYYPQVAELEKLKEKLMLSEQELQNAR